MARAGTSGVYGLLLRGLRGLDGGLVVGGGLALFKRDGPGVTGGQTVAQPVAVVLAHELGLAVYEVDRALVAGIHARAAAVALLFVNMNDLPDHKITSFLNWHFFSLCA